MLSESPKACDHSVRDAVIYDQDSGQMLGVVPEAFANDQLITGEAIFELVQQFASQILDPSKIKIHPGRFSRDVPDHDDSSPLKY